jgi:uncharacterized protein
VVTRERLARIEHCEDVVRSLGFRQVRVRDHGTKARLEVGRGELESALAKEEEIRGRLLESGFEEVEIHAYVLPSERTTAV